MTKAKKTALVAALTHRLRSRGSWCGETHIQKAIYFFQEMLKVHTGFEFILYKHGPFSFDLRDTITEMRADGTLEIRQQPYPYGPSLIVPPQRYADLERRFPNTLTRFAMRLDFVADRLGGRRVSDLEQLATALYVSLQPDAPTTSERRAKKIVYLKPHLSIDDARAAVATVNTLGGEALELDE